MIDNGSATAGIQLERTDCRKTKTTAITSSTAMVRVRLVSPTAALTDCERSMAMLTDTPCGSVASTDGRIFWICASVATMLAPGVG